MVLAEGIVVGKDEKIGGGNCLVTTRPFKKDEMIWEWDDNDDKVTPRTWEWIEALPEGPKQVFKHFMYKDGENKYYGLAEFETLPMDQWHTVTSSDPSMYMNHSCDPTTWFVTPKLMTARRDLVPGDHITFDYCTSEEHDQTWECKCGYLRCRKTISGRDWMNPVLQKRYEGHFQPHLQARIDSLRAEHVAEGVAQNASLVAQWGITQRHDPHLGTYLVASKLIPQGALVITCPPNQILSFDQVVDKGLKFVQAITVYHDPSMTLFSMSQSDEDMDNFINHSCDPNMIPEVRASDLCVLFHAARAIPPETSLTFDYDKTEVDMGSQKVDFECKCGAPNCRGAIQGSS